MFFSLLLSLAGMMVGQTTLEDPGPKPSASPYDRWTLGPSRDPGFFPIAVWVQDPRNAKRYREAGINLYVGLWKGPTEAHLAALKEAGVGVICQQNSVGLTHRDDPTIVAWMHGDEPDNAQPVTDPTTGRSSYGPPVRPEKIVADYERLRDRDPSRPILLNLGQGVANDAWKGRGSGASIDDYPQYVRGSDLVSFDVYPVAGIDRKDGADLLWYVAKGIDRLVDWTGGKKPIWNCIECTHISAPGSKATPDQVKAEVWMSLIHGSRGLIYFVHQFKPTFNEHALLDDPEMLKAVTAVNLRIKELAPVLNSPDSGEKATVRTSSPEIPVDAMTRRREGTTYVFAVGMRNGSTEADFEVPGLPPRATAEVLGEGRSLAVEGGRFRDTFAPYAVHLYAIRP